MSFMASMEESLDRVEFLMIKLLISKIDSTLPEKKFVIRLSQDELAGIASWPCSVGAGRELYKLSMTRTDRGCKMMACLLMSFSCDSTKHELIFTLAEPFVRSWQDGTIDDWKLRSPKNSVHQNGRVSGLYQELLTHQNEGRAVLSVDSLRVIMGCKEDQYVQYGPFKLRCLQPVINKINNAYDADFSVRMVDDEPDCRSGRKVVNVAFVLD